MSSESLRLRRKSIEDKLDIATGDLISGLDETGRVIGILQNTHPILDDLETQFCKQTKLEPLDVSILFVAIGLQIARQYLLTSFPQRMDDQMAAKRTSGHGEEHSNRHHRYYNPSLNEIITNPVPFDANIGANGVLSGGGELRHRVTAIGHDPILGLIFGTANIATSTLTTAKMTSYHIRTGGSKRDEFGQKARTDLVLKRTMDKLVSQGVEGKTIVAASMMKEIIHLKSDMNTKHSLPLPFISVIDPQLASRLASFGLDMANVLTVARQASYAILINSIIAMFHGLFSDATNERQRKLYEVKTRKILSYSNLVASSSNVAVVALTNDFNRLDLGGLAVTIYRLITDSRFIQNVKEEFIFGSYREMIMGDC